MAYHLAAAEVLTKARDLAAAARTLGNAARAWDADGTRQDPTACALMLDAEAMIGAVASMLPGMVENALAGAKENG